MTLAAERSAVRAGAGLFALADRSVLEVTGSDRVRWLDGMVTQDAKQLAVGRTAPALLLTRQGRIVAQFQLLACEGSFWLEGESAALAAARAQLARMIIADDVALAERGAEFTRFAIEGRRAQEALAAASGAPAPELGAWCDLTLAGVPVRAAAYGFTGLPAFQLFAPAAAGAAVASALLDAGRGAGLVAAAADTLECLRIEAGTPWPGRELDESVLPAEARMHAAIATDKGCYTGQEVVARMRSRGRLSHLLVGLRFGAGELPAPGASLELDGAAAGEVTSVVVSPEYGPIGLGFVRAEQAEPGAALHAGAVRAEVVALPFAR